MRIAWVVPGGVDESGRERVVPSWLWLLRRMAARHDVVVFVTGRHSHARTYPLLGASIVDLGRPLGPGGLRLVSYHRALLRAMAAHGPFDVVHGFWGVPAGILAGTVAHRLKLPSLVTFDSGELTSLPEIEYGLQRTWRGRLQVRIASAAATRIGVTNEYMRTLARANGIEPILVPFGVDAALFATDGTRANAPPYRLIQVASVNRVKDQTTLLTALKHIVTRVPDTHLDLIGEDTLGGAMQTLAAQLGVKHHVAFHGFQPSDRLPPLYHAANVYVQSSRHEAGGISVLEAAAAGVPIVGTRVGYVSDWSPEAAIAVNVGDAAALGDAVVNLLQDPAKRERLGAAAHARALALDSDVTASRCESIYESIGARSGSSHAVRSR